MLVAKASTSHPEAVMAQGPVLWRQAVVAAFVFAIGLGPTVFFMVALNMKSFRGPAALGLICVTVVCTWVSYWLSRKYLRPQQLTPLSQTEDVESGQESETTAADAPPVYEVVVAKPPPYEYLFTEGEEGTRQGGENGCVDSDLPTYSEVAPTPSPV